MWSALATPPTPTPPRHLYTNHPRENTILTMALKAKPPKGYPSLSQLVSYLEGKWLGKVHPDTDSPLAAPAAAQSPKDSQSSCPQPQGGQVLQGMRGCTCIFLDKSGAATLSALHTVLCSSPSPVFPPTTATVGSFVRQ